jgi:hypothetical protein
MMRMAENFVSNPSNQGIRLSNFWKGYPSCHATKSEADRRKSSLSAICRFFFSREEGQSMSEYAIAVLFIGLAGLVIFKLFPNAIRGYLNRFYMVVSSPIP